MGILRAGNNGWFVVCLLVMLAANSVAVGAIATEPFKDFADLSLDDLLKQVVVTASRQEQALDETPVTTHVITEDEIRRSPAQNLADLLRTIPGFQTKGWLSGFSNCSFRGMVGASVINERILWIVDGVPVNDVRDGGVWTDATLPLHNIKRIEVISGPGSALYGSNALVGVVHLFTRNPEDVLKTGHRGELTVSLSSYDTTVDNLTFAGKSGRASWLVSGDYGSTQGTGLVRDQNRPGEDAHSDRDWNWVRGKLHWNAGNIEHRLQVGGRHVFQEYDGANFVVQKLYNWRRAEEWLDWQATASRSARVSDKFVVSWHRYLEHFRDFADVPGLAYDIDSSRWHLQAQRDIRWRKHSASLGLGLRSERYEGNDFYPDHRNILKNNFNVFMQDELRLSRLWTLTFGGRYDTHPNYKAVWSPHVTLSRRFNDRKGRIRYTYNTAFKEPSNWQSYIDQPSGMGNPNMQPEELRSHELMVEYQFKRELFARAAAFWTHHKNVILEIFDPFVADPAFAQYNIFGKFHPQQPGVAVTIRGWEAELSKRFGPRNRIWVNATGLQTHDDNNAPQWYDAPIYINAGYYHAFDQRTSIDIVHHRVGATYDSVPPAFADVPAYTVTGASLNLKLSDTERVKLSGWNLGRGVYQEMLGAPLPGTTWRAEYSHWF